MKQIDERIHKVLENSKKYGLNPLDIIVNY